MAEIALSKLTREYKEAVRTRTPNDELVNRLVFRAKIDGAIAVGMSLSFAVPLVFPFYNQFLNSISPDASSYVYLCTSIGSLIPAILGLRRAHQFKKLDALKALRNLGRL